MRTRLFPSGVFGALLFLCAHPAAPGAVTFGQLDSFNTGSTLGWSEGDPTTNPPEVVSTGDGNGYLSDFASGEFGPGGRQVVFNQQQWTGNYNAAGVTRIDVSLANFGPSPLSMRLAFRSPTDTRYASTNAVELPADGTWRRVSFDLTPDALTRVGGLQGLSDVLSNVATLRLLSAQAPGWNGDILAGTMGIDDIRALRLPGDADFDGRVNAADQLLVRNHLGDSGAGVDWRAGDFNFDNRVDARDLVLLRRNLGQSIPTGGAVAIASAASPLPDPAGGAAALLAALALLARRGRDRTSTRHAEGAAQGERPERSLGCREHRFDRTIRGSACARYTREAAPAACSRVPCQ
jgi:hypothetical protein